MSGTAILMGNGELHVDDGLGTTLTIRFDQPGNNSQSGGAIHALVGSFPINTPGGKHVYGFGAGYEDKMHSVRVAVEELHSYKIVTYTVTADY